MNLTQLDQPVDVLVQSLAPAALRMLQDELTEAAGVLKRRKETFEAVMTRLFGDGALKAYQVEKKDTGTVRVAASNTLRLKVERDKDVKWDQAALRAALDAMKPEDAKHYAKIELGVDERKYTAAPAAIQTALQPARTVKPGKMKFTFEEMETA